MPTPGSHRRGPAHERISVWPVRAPPSRRARDRTDAGGLDHRHVVGAVANGQRAALDVLLDQQHHLGLQRRRRRTEQYSGEHRTPPAAAARRGTPQRGRAFCRGDTRQQMTERHISASLRNASMCSGWSANCRVWPSMTSAKFCTTRTGGRDAGAVVSRQHADAGSSACAQSPRAPRQARCACTCPRSPAGSAGQGRPRRS